MANNKPLQGHSHEALGEIGGFGKAVAESFGNDFLKDGWNDTWAQILGKSSSSEKKHTNKEQSLAPQTQGEIFHVDKHKNTNEKAYDKKAKPAKSESKAEAAINYYAEVARSAEKALHTERQEQNQTMQQLLGELKRLANSTKVLQMEFGEVTVEQAPKEVGAYHLSFLEWMLLTVRAARQKVENSGAWLATVKGKNGKKRWGNKERKDWFSNTSKSLSSESVVATQTG